MMNIIILSLITLGTVFVLLAAVGVVRMPDLYMRISVTTKAATLGIGLILGGAAFHFGETSTTSRSLAIVFFLLLTAPVTAHLIGKASYFVGIPLWKKSVTDDLKEAGETNSLLGLPDKEESMPQSRHDPHDKEKQKQADESINPPDKDEDEPRKDQ